MNKMITTMLICPLLFSCNVEQSGSHSEEVSSSSEEILTTESSNESIADSSIVESNESLSEIPEIQFTQKVNMTYEFTGDEKDKPGFAQGLITITPTESKRNTGFYLVYLANEFGLLTEYDEFASIEITGKPVTYTVKDGLYLPSEATKLAVFESGYRFLDNHPDITSAVDIISIDSNKKLNLGQLQYRLGVTSDVHMNFEELGFGSLLKWDNAMNFFYSNNVDNVIVTGDMTGDSNLDFEYRYYMSVIDSYMDVNDVYECIGNHANTPNNINLFTKYTSGNDEVHPYEGSPYYYVLKKGKQTSYRDNLFIFMAQEINGPSDSPSYDNFSKQQIDWLENVLKEFDNSNTNIFLIEHAPFLNWSPGDRLNGDYARKITFKESYTQTMRLKGLLETYKNVIMMTGHTHLTFYENENYSDQYDSFCRMVHVSSGTQTSSYNHGSKLISDTDGRKYNSPEYGSEGYLVDIYKDYIVYTGYNLSTNRIIPSACILLPTTAYGGSGGPVVDPTIKDVTESVNIYDVIKGQGTKENPYLISNEYEFKLLTDEFNKSTSSSIENMFGYNKYFKQTADINMSNVNGYFGTSASGSSRYTFAGNYNGNGYNINVDISGNSQQSIFPYTYGVISNLSVTGTIRGGICAQVVRALHGQLINCIFSVDLDAEQEAGAIYSNYGYVYNLYTTGKHLNGVASPIATNHNSTKYYNVYYYRTNTNLQPITSSYGTMSNDLNLIVSSFNDIYNSQYNVAHSYLNGYDIIEVEALDNKLVFKNKNLQS